MKSRIRLILLIGMSVGLVIFISSVVEIKYGFVEKIITEKEKRIEAENKAKLETQKIEAEKIAIAKAEAERKVLQAQIEAQKLENERIAALARAEAERKELEAKIIADKLEADRIAIEKKNAEKKAYDAKIQADKAEADRIAAKAKADEAQRQADAERRETERIEAAKADAARRQSEKIAEAKEKAEERTRYSNVAPRTNNLAYSPKPDYVGYYNYTYAYSEYQSRDGILYYKRKNSDVNSIKIDINGRPAVVRNNAIILKGIGKNNLIITVKFIVSGFKKVGGKYSFNVSGNSIENGEIFEKKENMLWSWTGDPLIIEYRYNPPSLKIGSTHSHTMYANFLFEDNYSDAVIHGFYKFILIP
ncbi:MAG: hypothetical protein AB7S72_16665 [Draconibacterium sp.]